MDVNEWCRLFDFTDPSITTMNEKEIIMHNYDLYQKLEQRLFYERIGKVKRNLATMVEKDKRERPPLFYYNRQEFKCNIAYANAFNRIMVTEADTAIIAELDKIIKMEEQKKTFKQLFVSAVMVLQLSAYAINHLLGENDGDMLPDENLISIQAYNQDNPELLKQYRRLKLMAG